MYYGVSVIWKELHGWSYEFFELDVDPGALPEFKDLVELWQCKRGDRILPAWRDFDFFDFKGWHGKIAVYDIQYDPFDYVFRLSGSDFDKVYGQSMTGVSGSKMLGKMNETPVTMEFYEKVCREMLIGKVSGPLNWLDRGFLNVTFLEFPLSEDGKTVTQTFEALLY